MLTAAGAGPLGVAGRKAAAAQTRRSVDEKRREMPYSTCPTCGDLFHLFVHGDKTAWYAEHAPGIPVGEAVALQCFGCWKPLKEYDVVTVIKVPANKPNIKVGDVATVLLVLQSDNKKTAYELECVGDSTSKGWVETLERLHVRYDMKRNPQQTTEPTAAASASVDSQKVDGQ